MVKSSNEIKYDFRRKFSTFLQNNVELKLLLLDIMADGTAYIIGGFLRDVINNQRSRDVDIMVEISHELLIQKLNYSGLNYSVNRHNGIKVLFDNMDVDIWSISNNWAFKQNLVKLSSEDRLASIARGCFYNYDALVINLHTYRFNIKYYRDFVASQTLDILCKKPLYKKSNPTIEANILRAFFLRKKFEIKYSKDTIHYLAQKIGYLNDKYNSSIKRLNEIKSKYPKYDKVLTDEEVKDYLNEVKMLFENDRQIKLNL